VVRRLSDLNYLIKLSRNKEIVVNVNEIKKCFRGSFWRPPTAQGKERRGADVTDELETFGSRRGRVWYGRTTHFPPFIADQEPSE
jgi:hypothetical protein